MTALAERPGQWGEPELVAVTEPVRRVAAARLSDRDSVDDVVQETLTRLLAARDRLDGSALLPYAVTVARNLAVEQGRSGERARRHAHRVADLREPERPEEPVLRREEERALAAALRAMPEHDRRLLLAHELEGQDTTALAAATGSTPGGVAARLARTRARLRLDYVLALRGTPLPTLRCRPVLLAISAGDRRRQQSLQAGAHLLRCSTCAEISQPLLTRRRALAGVFPWVWGPALLHLLRPRRSTQGPQIAVTAAAVVGVIMVAVVAQAHQTPPASPARPTPTTSAPREPAAAPVRDRRGEGPADTPERAGTGGPAGHRSVLSIAGQPLRVDGEQGLRPHVGQRVVARSAVVLSVPADEGFWLAAPGGGRVWVQLRAERESPRRVRPGQWLSFTAHLVGQGDRFAARVGVTRAEGAAVLDGQGAHLLVSARDMRLTGG